MAVSLTDKDYNSKLTLLKTYGKVHDTPYHDLVPIKTEYDILSAPDISGHYMWESMEQNPYSHEKDFIDSFFYVEKTERVFRDIGEIIRHLTNGTISLNNTDVKPSNNVIHHSFSVPNKSLFEYIGKFINETKEEFEEKYFEKVIETQVEELLSVEEFKERFFSDEFDPKRTFIDVIINKDSEEVYVIFAPKSSDYNAVTHNGGSLRKILLPFYVVYDYKDVEQVFENIVKLHEYETIGKSGTIGSLADLWFYQINELELNKTETMAKTLNLDLQNIYDEVVEEVVSFKKTRPSISFYELFDFFKEIQQREITTNSQKAQEFISYQTDDNLLNTLHTHQNFDSINEQFKRVDKKTFDELVKVLEVDKRFVSDRKIKNIYAINDERPVPKGYTRMKALHGSNHASILSILFNSLRTIKEMNTHSIDFVNTGQSLGQGVYFAKITEISKSVQYIENHGRKGKGFVFLADLDYDPNNVKSYNGYGHNEDTSKYSIIKAERVSAYGYSEYVMPHSKHINLRYLIEVERV